MTKLTTREIQELARKAGVDKPVMSVRVVGDRIELRLLGGEVVPVPQVHSHAPLHPGSTPTTGQHATAVQLFSPHEVFADMTVARLKRVAAYLEMSGYSRLTKAKLIAALVEQFDNDRLQEAVINSAFS